MYFREVPMHLNDNQFETMIISLHVGYLELTVVFTSAACHTTLTSTTTISAISNSVA